MMSELGSGGGTFVLMLNGNRACYEACVDQLLGGRVFKSSTWLASSHRPWHVVGTQCRLVSLKTQALLELGFRESGVV